MRLRRGVSDSDSGVADPEVAMTPSIGLRLDSMPVDVRFKWGVVDEGLSF